MQKGAQKQNILFSFLSMGNWCLHEISSCRSVGSLVLNGTHKQAFTHKHTHTHTHTNIHTHTHPSTERSGHQCFASQVCKRPCFVFGVCERSWPLSDAAVFLEAR